MSPHPGLLFAVFASGTIAAAEPESVDELFALDLDELRQVKVETAARRALTAQESPGSVTVFTREEIRRLGASTLDELLNLVPGMRTYTFVGSDSSGKAVVESRGIYNPNGYMVLLLIDGQRINSQYTGNFTGANRWISLTPYQRVEVVRGPGSALYGGNAMLAVINLVSRTEQAEQEAFVEVGGSQHKRAGVQTGDGNLQQWHWRLWAEWQDDEGDDYPNAFDPLRIQDGTSDPRRGRDLQASVGNAELELQLRHHWRRSEEFYLLGRLANPINFSETEQNNARLSWKKQVDNLEWNVALSWLSASWQGLTRLAPNGVPPFLSGDLIAGPSLKHHEYQLSADLVHYLGANDVLNYGVAWEIGQIPRSASYANYDTRPPFTYFGEVRLLDDDAHRLVDDQDRELYSVYGQWDHAFGAGVRSVLGARLDQYDPGESKVSPRAAIIWQLPNDQTLKLQYSESFIPPSQADQFIRPSLVLQPPYTLKAMSGTSSELSWLHSTSDASLGITVYHQLIEDLIGRIPIGGGISTIINSGDVESSGIEMETSWQVTEGWLLRLNASHVFDVDTSNAPADFANSRDYAVRDLFALINHWQISDRWQLDLQGVYGSEIPALGTGDSYLLYNLHSRFMLSAQWELFAGIKNIGDEQSYSAEPGAGLGVDANGNIVRELPQRGRQWVLGLRYQFGDR